MSALNHQHVCTLHAVGSQDGTDCLVMEYLEGETLAARLEKGPIPLEQVLKTGVEVADALDKAHRQEIIQKTILDPWTGGNVAPDISIRGTMR